MTNSALKASDLNDSNIYKMKNNVIYYDAITKKAYYIFNKDASNYSLYSKRYMFSILIFIIVYLGFKKLLLGLILALLVFIVANCLFYLKFIPTLTECPNFNKPKKDNIIVRCAKNRSRIRNIFMCIGFILLSIMLIINAKINNYSGIYLLGNYVFSAICMLSALLDLIILIYQFKNNLNPINQFK